MMNYSTDGFLYAQDHADHSSALGQNEEFIIYVLPYTL
jgi:hypothetical protein